MSNEQKTYWAIKNEGEYWWCWEDDNELRVYDHKKQAEMMIIADIIAADWLDISITIQESYQGDNVLDFIEEEFKKYELIPITEEQYQIIKNAHEQALEEYEEAKDWFVNEVLGINKGETV